MSISYLPFTISNDLPTSIVADFDKFLVHIQAPSSYLTKAWKWLNRATLHALNQEMETFRVEESPKTDQIFYPLLDFFHHISLSANFFRVVKVKSKYRLQPTEVVEQYQQLQPVEKYFSLFESFWVYTDWVEMLSEQKYIGRYEIREDDEFVATLSDLPCNKTITLAQLRKRLNYFNQLAAAHFIRCLSFFGLLTYKLKPLSSRELQYSKGYIVLKSITITPFGSNFLQILNRERPLTRCNKPLRYLNGSECPGQKRADGQSGTEPFFEPFKQMLIPGTVIEKGLPTIHVDNVTGTFVVKVTLDGVWRTVAMSGKDTFDDLHLAIQAAYDFDNDHLYSFSFDSHRLHPRKSCHSPWGEETPFADELIIGQLNLYVGQKLLYIFDYGEWWEFDIEIIRITEEPHFGDFKILEQNGESLEQYPAYDDDF